MHSNNPLGLLDVVCGEPADVGSVHRYVHAGALFCFCSDACLARFIVDPHQFVGPERVAPTANVLAPRAAAPVAAPPAIVAHAETELQHAGPSKPSPPAAIAPVAPVRPAAAAPAAPRSPRGPHLVEPSPVTRRPPLTLEPIAPAGSGAGNVLASLFAWREKRFAARTCADLLKLHKIVAARNPGLAGAALYRQVVAAHNGGDLAFADAVLENAEQSFAIWPVQRALKFADVVHYLAATEFLAMAGGGRWIHADMKRIVAARVPHDL